MYQCSGSGSVCFLGLLYPDPQFVCTDPDPDPSTNKKKVKKTLDFYCIVTFIFEEGCKCKPSKKNKHKK
jgi:hypothetical protein